MLIYLIRHGETIYNAEKRYQGSLDVPLSEAGKAKLCRADFSPEQVYVTTRRRTRQTADILFPEARQVVAEGLEEMCFGVFEGRNYVEMEHDADYRAWVDGNCEGKCPGGESKAEFCQRVGKAFISLVDEALKAGTRRLVIVAHGGTQMGLLEQFAVPRKPYYDWYVGNGRGYLLDTETWSRDRRVQVLGTVDFTKDGAAC